jgi:hypothetical protein
MSSRLLVNSPPLSGIAGNTIIHSKAQSLSSADNRDPEEKMAELMELKQMKYVYTPTHSARNKAFVVLMIKTRCL